MGSRVRDAKMGEQRQPHENRGWKQYPAGGTQRTGCSSGSDHSGASCWSTDLSWPPQTTEDHRAPDTNMNRTNLKCHLLPLIIDPAQLLIICLLQSLVIGPFHSIKIRSLSGLT